MSTNQAENASEAMDIDPSLSPSKKRDRENIAKSEQNTNILNSTLDEHMAVEMNSAIAVSYTHLTLPTTPYV